MQIITPSCVYENGKPYKKRWKAEIKIVTSWKPQAKGQRENALTRPHLSKLCHLEVFKLTNETTERRQSYFSKGEFIMWLDMESLDITVLIIISVLSSVWFQIS